LSTDRRGVHSTRGADPLAPFLGAALAVSSPVAKVQALLPR
jgi:hypothetical protein